MKMKGIQDGKRTADKGNLCQVDVKDGQHRGARPHPLHYHQTGEVSVDAETVSQVDSVVLSCCNKCYYKVKVMLIEGEVDEIISRSLCSVSCL